MELSANADKIFKMKYAQKRANGRLEEWGETCVRVADYVSQAESNESNRLQYLADFTKIMLERTFVPGGRILANAGTNIKNLMNCFVLPIEDSRQSIYDTLGKAAEIFAWGGGIGYNFSHLRERGAPVSTTGGTASGPLSFMSLFDQTGEVISQASRRGAQMGIMNVDHPDILRFINFKNELNTRNQRLFVEYMRNLDINKLDRRGKKYFDVMRKTLADDQLTHFNMSVGITDEFMEALTNEASYGIMKEIAENAWLNGDPGVFFIDRANADNMVPYLGRIEATNPCGEVPLLPYEACCLGSINLERFVDGQYIDFAYLQDVVKFAVRFLDNVHELNETPVEEINEAVRMTRRIGLGVMGWADALVEVGIPYDHEDAFTLADIIAKTIQTTAWETSMQLAEERGEFPAFQWDNINWKVIDDLELERRPVRNVAVTSIAPTGSISLIADVNSGIEPFFSHNYTRNITEGIGNTAKETLEQSAVSDTVKTAHEISWKDHIKMQAMWQKWTCNAVSKTINMPNSATVDDIIEAYRMAWELGCKGITVYRDGSRLFQILNTEEEVPEVSNKMTQGLLWE
jgi:ribonucleoside-diphosphate reductase alpha chain